MSTTYTGVPANVTPSASPTITIPADGDPENVASVNTPFQKLTDYVANIFTTVINLFTTAHTWTATQTFSSPIAGPSSTPVAPTLNSGWSAANGLAYWKDASGTVHMKGTLGGPGTNPAFTLPVGFRPSSTGSRIFVAAKSLGDATGVSYVVVDNTGAVSCFQSNGTTVSPSYLDGISFLGEQ